MSACFKIRPASHQDLPAAIGLLRAEQLPTEDLRAEHLALVANGDAGILGTIGIEYFEKIALLRSLVVSPSARGEGIGRALVEALESMATREGIRELWLLTIDADAFFSALGFVIRDRELAPDAILVSEEFSRLCPADAVLMSKLTPVG